MELRVDISYNQVLRMVRQLPKKDIKRLTNTLQSEIAAEKPAKSFQKLILQAPIWTDSDIDNYKSCFRAFPALR
jgi:hypothetical protein